MWSGWKERLGASVLLIGHDMGLMAQFVDRVGVMYGGKLVETGPTGELFGVSAGPPKLLLYIREQRVAGVRFPAARLRGGGHSGRAHHGPGRPQVF